MKVGKRSGHSFVALLLTAVRKPEASSTSHGRPWKNWQVIHSGRTCEKPPSTCVDKTRKIGKPLNNSQLFHKSS
ncbi:hypothetical protein D8666_06320 [Ochrobactrum soli]|nr:hypothetical protein D8666_06320 [[Ochrobactrum] soli]RRD27620.1 hypothetical protein ECB98_00740 [Brucellaceae bacterium VT-16-1752]